MRLLYASVAVCVGLLTLAATYAFVILAMFMASRPGNTQAVILYVILVFLLASLISLVAAFLNPRKPLTPRLLLASAALWLLAGTFFGAVVFTDPAMPKDPLMTLQFTALLVAPTLLPLAAWFLVRWQFTPA